MNDSQSQFMAWLERHENWYESRSTWWARLLVICKVLSLLASIATIIVAAAITPGDFEKFGRWLLVGAAALAAISAEMLSQLKVREMEALREEGNIEASAIVAYARQKLDEYADDPTRISKLKDEIRERIAALELRQHRGHVFIEAADRSGRPKKPR